MKIDTVYWADRMWDHLGPIWDAIPDEYKGEVYQRGNYRRARRSPNVLLINHPSGLHKITPWKKDIVLTVHDFGETFGDTHNKIPDYLQPRNKKVKPSLFLPPGRHLHEQQQDMFPDVPSVMIGCPKLDPYHLKPPRPRNDRPVVALSFTWNWQKAKGQPVGAYSYYKSIVEEIKNVSDWVVIGNAHPHMYNTIRYDYMKNKITYHTFEWVMEHADILVCDYSSIIYEFASTGRPVVLLNAPWYKDIPHDQSIRFWKCAGIGLNVWEPKDVIPAIYQTLHDDPIQKSEKQAILDYVYHVRDGTSASTAANVIVKFLEGGFNNGKET